MTPGRAEYWLEHIKSWQKSGMSQTEYCNAKSLSTSNFSKWKKKLAPGAKAKKYKLKNKYSKHTKLSDDNFETLMVSFFGGEDIRATANKTGISSKTIATTYHTFQDHVVSNALIYPHLFFHAGPLLLLGPPPDSQARLASYRDEFENRKSQVRSNEEPEGRLRNNIEISFRLLMNYMTYEWSLAEAFVFREIGLELYYIFTYCAQHGTDPNIWDLELHKKMALEINLVIAFVANMNHWATERHGESYFENQNWEGVFRERARRDINDAWTMALVQDLQWTLQRNPIKGKRKLRNTYWDEYAPGDTAIEEAKRRLAI